MDGHKDFCCRKNRKELSNTHSVSIGWWTFCCKSVGGCLGAKAFCWRDRHSDIQGRRRPTVWWQEGNSSAQRGWEREKNVFLSMKLDTLNVDVGHLFCFGEQINERPKAPRTNERPNPNTNIVACMQYNRTIFKPAYPMQHQMPKLAGPTKKICPNHLTLPDYIFDSVFYILWTLDSFLDSQQHKELVLCSLL